MENKLTVSVSPHLHNRNMDTRRIMLHVIIALIPALCASIVHFGWRTLLVSLFCVAACVFFEWGFEKLVRRPSTVGDLSAVVTGLLLSYNLPVSIPLWQAAFGCLVAIVAVKQLFGGLGKNFANPAITARIVMMIAFANTMTTWTAPRFCDAVSSATPLALLSSGKLDELPTLLQMFLGQRAGCLGETSVLAILLGGIYLIGMGIISWRTPVAFLATVFGLTALLGKEPVYQLMSGGLMLGAFFMATDYVTTPVTALGQLIFGFGCGFLTVIIRVFGNYPEGVSFSILLMNIVNPYISSIRITRPFGAIKAKKEKEARSVEKEDTATGASQKPKESLWRVAVPVIVLLSICLLISGALAITNHSTSPVIEAREAAQAQAARQEVLPEADGFTQLSVENLPDTVKEVYKADNGVGYVLLLETKGYGGPMRIICGLDPHGAITQCKTLSHSETAGIGSKTTEDWFRNQFAGLKSTEGIDTISRATISSKAYIGAIQDALSSYALIQEADR